MAQKSRVSMVVVTVLIVILGVAMFSFSELSQSNSWCDKAA